MKLPFVIKRIGILSMRLNSFKQSMITSNTFKNSGAAVGSPFPDKATSAKVVSGGVLS
jgi:hypothetical protein